MLSALVLLGSMMLAADDPIDGISSSAMIVAAFTGIFMFFWILVRAKLDMNLKHDDEGLIVNGTKIGKVIKDLDADSVYFYRTDIHFEYIMVGTRTENTLHFQKTISTHGN
jgi:hypothetical protein